MWFLMVEKKLDYVKIGMSPTPEGFTECYISSLYFKDEKEFEDFVAKAKKQGSNFKIDRQGKYWDEHLKEVELNREKDEAFVEAMTKAGPDELERNPEPKTCFCGHCEEPVDRRAIECPKCGGSFLAKDDV